MLHTPIPPVEPVIVTTRAALTAAVAEGVERALRRAEATRETQPAEGFGWVSNRDAMRMLGLSKPTLARYRANRVLPFSKIGNKVFYRVSDVEALLASRASSLAGSDR